MRVGSLLVKSPLRERRGFRDVYNSRNTIDLKLLSKRFSLPLTKKHFD